MTEPQNNPGDNNDNNESPEEREYKRTRRETLKRIMEDVRENGIGAVIPGFKAINRAVAWTVSAVFLGIAGGVGHYVYDASYKDDYNAALQDLADRSAQACGTDADHKAEIYERVMDDVRATTKNSWLNGLPVVGNWIPRLGWLPNKTAYDALMAAESNGIVLYPAGRWLSGYDDGIQAVLHNDGTGKPVINYKDIDDGQLTRLLEDIDGRGAVPEGALVLVWNDAHKDYETAHIAPAAIKQGEPTLFTISGHYGAGLELPANKCGTVKAESDGGLRDWLPNFGGDDEAPVDAATPADEPVEETAPVEVQEQPAAEEEPGLLRRTWDRFKPFGGEEEPPAPVPPAPAPAFTPQ